MYYQVEFLTDLHEKVSGSQGNIMFMDVTTGRPHWVIAQLPNTLTSKYATFDSAMDALKKHEKLNMKILGTKAPDPYRIVKVTAFERSVIYNNHSPSR